MCFSEVAYTTNQRTQHREGTKADDVPQDQLEGFPGLTAPPIAMSRHAMSRNSLCFIAFAHCHLSGRSAEVRAIQRDLDVGVPSSARLRSRNQTTEQEKQNTSVQKASC